MDEGENERGTGKKRAFLTKRGLIVAVFMMTFSLSAKYRFCADGGANRLHDLHPTEEERAKYGSHNAFFFLPKKKEMK